MESIAETFLSPLAFTLRSAFHFGSASVVSDREMGVGVLQMQRYDDSIFEIHGVGSHSPSFSVTAPSPISWPVLRCNGFGSQVFNTRPWVGKEVVETVMSVDATIVFDS